MRSYLTATTYALIFCALGGLSGCHQATAAPVATDTHPPSAEKIIYRPKVKLTATDPDPAKLKTLLKGWAEITQEHYDRARKILLPLANAGYTDAQIGMAYSYMPQEIIHPKKPVPYDWKQGIPWLKKAADNGNARAQWMLSGWYFDGFSGKVKRDYFAIQWDKVNYYLHAAAEQGLAIAQMELASLYEDSLGVPMNPEALEAYEKTHKIKAYMWYILASQRFPAYTGVGINRKGLAESLARKLVRRKAFTPAEIAEGKQMVKDWIRTHPDAYRVEYPPELYPEP